MTTLLSLLAGPSTAIAQDLGQQVNLRPHWAEGQSSRYEFWTTQQRTYSIATSGGHKDSAERTIETTGEITWQVDRIRSDGTSTCTLNIDWISATFTDHEGQTRTTDSRKSNGDTKELYALFKAMTSVNLKFEVGTDGTIESVSGTNAMRRKAKDSETIPEDLYFIETASDLATLVGPPKKLAIGKNWKTDFKWNYDANFLIHGFLHKNITYTLKSVEELEGIQVATVHGKAKLKLEPDQTDFPDDAKIDIELSDSSHETQVIFDLTRSEVIGRNTTEHLTIDATIRSTQRSVSQRIEETTQSQVIRISEQQLKG